jgi:DNA-binding transcriptional ArsR family regulator
VRGQQAWGDVKRSQILRAMARAKYPLTVRMLGRRVRLSSTSSVQNHIEQLYAQGLRSSG